MSKTAIFFDAQTGVPVARWCGSESQLTANIPKGCAVYDGDFDIESRRIDLAVYSQIQALRDELAQHAKVTPSADPMQLVPEQPISDIELEWRAQQQAAIDALMPKLVIDYVPPAPSADHEWNADARRWHMSEVALRRMDAQSSINTLESKQARALRELMLNPQDPNAKARIQAIDDQISALRSHIT